MKTLLKIITLCLLLFSTTAHAAFISFTFTNVAYPTVPDTNVFKLIPVSGPNANADGSFDTIGIGLRIIPPTNGLTVTNLGQNNWLVTNQFLGQGYYIRVPLDSGPTIYPSGSLLISGGNLFVTVVSGSGGTNIVTANQITNALGYPVLSPNQITNAAAQTTNGMTTIVYTNPATLVTQAQLTNAVQAQAASNTNYANTAAQTQGISNTNFTLTVSNAVSTNSIGALIATNALLLSQINALNTSLLAAIAATANLLTNNNLNLSNSVTGALIASNAQQTASLNTVSNQFQFSKQPASITLSNLNGTGAWTNIVKAGTNISIATNGGMVTWDVPTQAFLTNGFYSSIPTNATNQFVTGSQLAYVYTATNIFNSYTNFLENGVFTNAYLMTSNLSLPSWNGIYRFWRMTNDMAIYTNSPFGTAFLFCGNTLSSYGLSVFQTSFDYDRFNALGVWQYDNFAGSGLPPSTLWEISQDQPSIEFMDVLSPGIIMSLNAQVINFGGVTTLTNSRYLDFISNPYKVTAGAGEIVVLAYTTNGVPLASIGQDSSPPDLDGTLTTWGSSSGSSPMGNAGRFIGNPWPWQLAEPGADTRALILKGEYALAGKNFGGTFLAEARAFADGRAYHGTFNNSFKIATNGLTAVGNLTDVADDGKNTLKPKGWLNVIGDGSRWSTHYTNGSYLPAFVLDAQKLVTNAVIGAFEYNGTNWFFTDDNTNRHIAFMDLDGSVLTNLQFGGFTNIGTAAHSNAIAFQTPVQIAGSNFLNAPQVASSNFLQTLSPGMTNQFLTATATNDASVVLRLWTVNATNDLNTTLRTVISSTNTLLLATIAAGDAAERAAMILTNATTTNSFISLSVAQTAALIASNVTQNANLLSASNNIITGISAVSTSGLISNNVAGKGTNNSFVTPTLTTATVNGLTLGNSLIVTPTGNVNFDQANTVNGFDAAAIGANAVSSSGAYSVVIASSGNAGIPSGVTRAAQIGGTAGSTNFANDTFLVGQAISVYNVHSVVFSDDHNGRFFDTTNNQIVFNYLNGMSINDTNAKFGYPLYVNGPIWATGFSVSGGPQFVPSPFNTNTPAVVTNIVAALAATNTLTASNSVALWHGGFWNVLADFWTTNSPSTVTGAVQSIATVIFNSQGLTVDNAYTNIAIAKAPVNMLLTNIIKLNFTNPAFGNLASFVWVPTANIFTNSLNGLFITNNLAAGNYLVNTPALSALFQLPNTTPIPGASWTAVNGVGTCFSGYGASWDALNSGIIVTNLNFNSFDTATATLLNAAASGTGFASAATNLLNGTTLTNAVVTMTTNQTFKVFLNTNGFGELNVQNTSTGSTASSDWTATADNGTAATNYFNGGINGSRFIPGAATGILGSTNDTYLISSAGNSFYDVIGGGDLLYFVSQLTTAAAVVTNASIGPAGLASSVPITINGAAVVTTNFSGTLTFTNNTTAGIKFVTPASSGQPSGLLLATNGVVSISGNGRTYTFDPVGQQIQGLNNLFSDGGTELLLQGNGSNLRLHAQTANGNFRFQVNNVTIATITGTNINSYGGIIASNGFSSYASNTLAPSAISFPATTVNWTNNTGRNIFLFIDNTGVTGTTTKINGVQIYSSLVGDVLLPLQPGEYFSETYTIGTPTATMKPE